MSDPAPKPAGYTRVGPCPLDDYPVVRKVAGYIPVSCCVLADNGGPPCNHPAPPPLSRRERFRYWRRGRILSARTRLGEWIAGQPFNEDNDW